MCGDLWWCRVQHEHQRRESQRLQMRQQKADVMKIVDKLPKPVKTDGGDTFFTITIDRNRKLRGQVRIAQPATCHLVGGRGHVTACVFARGCQRLPCSSSRCSCFCERLSQASGGFRRLGVEVGVLRRICVLGHAVH